MAPRTTVKDHQVADVFELEPGGHIPRSTLAKIGAHKEFTWRRRYVESGRTLTGDENTPAR